MFQKVNKKPDDYIQSSKYNQSMGMTEILGHDTKHLMYHKNMTNRFPMDRGALRNSLNLGHGHEDFLTNGKIVF